jgi:enolase-phosphatase E1
VTRSILGESIRSLLLDVEGTTTPISFVAETLVPYARARLAGFLRERWNEEGVRRDIARLEAERRAERESGAPAWVASDARASALAYLLWLTDRDRKSTALKSVQGEIWKDGYESGALVAPVYPDVPPALARWTAEARDVSIYSSGSVLAQRLLFAHTDAGDLTPFLRSFFDTTTGPKREARSYARIAESLGRAPRELLFVSDVVPELDAARGAGCATALVIRPGNARPGPSDQLSITTFDSLVLGPPGA